MIRVRALAVVATATAVALIAGTAPGAASPRPIQNTAIRQAAVVPPPQVGIAYGAVGVFKTQAQQAAEAELMRRAGSTWTRTDVPFAYLQPTRGAAYRWDIYDPYLRRLRAQGNVLAILQTSPAWARPAAYADVKYNHMAPSRALVQGYCRTTAAHLLPMGIPWFEIGNEVNLGRPGVNPAANVYRDTWWTPCVAGIREAERSTGLRARIMLGSVQRGVGNPADADADQWLRNVARDLTMPRDFNELAIHPYTRGVRPSQSDRFMGFIRETERTFPTKRVWINEFGQTACCQPGGTVEGQAAILREALSLWAAPRKPTRGPFLVYSIQDRDDALTNENRFGLFRRDGTARPSFYVVRDYAATAPR